MYCATDQNTSFLVINYEFITWFLRSLKYFEEEVKRIVWIKERLPWAERLDHLQSVFSRSAGGRRFRRLLVYQAPATHVKQKQRKIIL